MSLLPGKSEAILLVILIVLWAIPRLERWISQLRSPRVYGVVCSIGEGKMEEMERLFRESGLRVRKARWIQLGGDMISQWEVHGAPEAHKRLVIMLFAHPQVKGFQMPAGCFSAPEATKSVEWVQLSAAQPFAEGTLARLADTE